MENIGNIEIYKDTDGDIFTRLVNVDVVSPLDGNDLDKIIQSLSAVRAETNPPVTPEVPKQFERIFNVCNSPVTWIGSTFEGVIVVRMRHSGLGWISFAFSPDDATMLKNFLRICIENTKKEPISTSKQ